MPYVLRQRGSGEIASAMQKNGYMLDYYGVRWWASEEEAIAERDDFLASGSYGSDSDWDIIAVDEQKVKLMNVKLKNNAALRVTMDREGTITAGPRGDQ